MITILRVLSGTALTDGFLWTTSISRTINSKALSQAPCWTVPSFVFSTPKITSSTPLFPTTGALLLSWEISTSMETNWRVPSQKFNQVNWEAWRNWFCNRTNCRVLSHHRSVNSEWKAVAHLSVYGPTAPPRQIQESSVTLLAVTCAFPTAQRRLWGRRIRRSCFLKGKKK